VSLLYGVISQSFVAYYLIWVFLPTYLTTLRPEPMSQVDFVGLFALGLFRFCCVRFRLFFVFSFVYCFVFCLCLFVQVFVYVFAWLHAFLQGLSREHDLDAVGQSDGRIFRLSGRCLAPRLPVASWFFCFFVLLLFFVVVNFCFVFVMEIC